MNYFRGCGNVGEIKAKYRHLAMANHPDRGGDTATMQSINTAYHDALMGMDGFESRGTDGKTHIYRYNAGVEQMIIDKLNEILAARLDGITIELIGTWLWIGGDTKKHKEALKKLKLSWHSKRKLWYFRKRTYRRRYSGNGGRTFL